MFIVQALQIRKEQKERERLKHIVLVYLIASSSYDLFQTAVQFIYKYLIP